MPSLDDLKSEPVKHENHFIPTINQGDTVDQETAQTVRTAPSKGISIDISRGRGQQNRQNRQAADFSNLPKAEEPKGNLEVKKAEDIESEVFAKGGIFDKYLSERVNEYAKDMNERLEEEENKKYEQDDSDNSDGENEFDEVIDDIPVTNINKVNGYKEIDIMGPGSRNDNIEDTETFEEAKMSDEYDVNNEDDYDEDEEDEAFITEAEKKEKESIEPMEVNSNTVNISRPKLNISIDDTVEYENAEEEIKESTSDNTTKPTTGGVVDKLHKITRSYMSYTPEDDDDEVETNTTPDEDEQIDYLKNLISEKLNPVSKKLNIKGFTIAKRGTTSNNILATDAAAMAKWVLPSTGIVFQLREISGANLENIRSHIEATNGTQDLRGALRIIFDHIVSPKPENFETWLKSIAFADYDHLFFGAYIASFSEANYLPVDCRNPVCRKSYLTENIPIMDMVKFNNSESEAKFWDLYKSDVVNANGLYHTEIIPMTDKFAIAFREPSLYSIVVENNYFNDEFIRRYGQSVAYSPYIDNIYYIDVQNQTLIPIDHKTYANNIARTARSKVQRFDKILNTFNADQHAIIAAYINKINERVDWFTYQIPETTCPHCGQINTGSSEQAANLVFTRNRLAVLATI